jgi:hypothetical protein
MNRSPPTTLDVRSLSGSPPDVHPQMPIIESRETRPSSQGNRALDAANFFLADVRDGLGPYLAIYLLTEQAWDEARIGIVMSIAAGQASRRRLRRARWLMRPGPSAA